MKRMRYLGLWMGIGLLCLSACGQLGQSEQVEQKQQEQQEQQQQTPKLREDWKSAGFQVSEELQEKRSWWVKEYKAWSHERAEEEIALQGTIMTQKDIGSRVGSLLRYYCVYNSEKQNFTGWIECYNPEEDRVIVREVDQDTDGEIPMVVRLVGEDRYVIQRVLYGEDENGVLIQQKNHLIVRNEEGESADIDVRQALLEQGLIEESYDGILLSDELFMDAEGYSYVRGNRGSRSYAVLYVFSPEGAFVQKQKAADGGEFLEPLRTEAGDLIFCEKSFYGKGNLFYVFDSSKQEMVQLANIGEEFVRKLLAMEGCHLYYQNNEGIVCWNVETGERFLCFHFQENGISAALEKMLVIREGKMPLLRLRGMSNDMERDWLVELSEEEIINENDVNIVSIEVESQRVRESVAQMAMDYPGYRFHHSSVNGSDAETLLAKLFVEMAEGKGPDILFVSQEDMDMFHEKDALADLTTFLEFETREKVLPGVLQMGSRDGRLIGLAPGISALSFCVGDEVWEKDSWTLEELVDLMEQGKLRGRLQDGSILHASVGTPIILLRSCLTDTALIDWEKGVSHFDAPYFIRWLELLGREPVEEMDMEAYYKGAYQDCLATVGLLSASDLWDFEGERRVPGSHYVGFPSESGNGNYLETKGFLVVNKNTPHKEAVAAYLSVILSETFQEKSVTEFMAELPVVYLDTDNMRERTTDDGLKLYWNGREMHRFPDGTTSLEQAMEFLEQCAPMPEKHVEIENIIYEELKAYEAGDISAEQAAHYIDNRVQLYLDENS